MCVYKGLPQALQEVGWKSFIRRPILPCQCLLKPISTRNNNVAGPPQLHGTMGPRTQTEHIDVELETLLLKCGSFHSALIREKEKKKRKRKKTYKIPKHGRGATKKRNRPLQEWTLVVCCKTRFGDLSKKGPRKRALIRVSL